MSPDAVPMAWLRLRSGSLWPAVLAHGVYDSLLGELWASGIEGDAVTPRLASEGGLMMPFVTAAMAAAVLWMDGRSRPAPVETRTDVTA